MFIYLSYILWVIWNLQVLITWDRIEVCFWYHKILSECLKILLLMANIITSFNIWCIIPHGLDSAMLNCFILSILEMYFQFWLISLIRRYRVDYWILKLFLWNRFFIVSFLLSLTITRHVVVRIRLLISKLIRCIILTWYWKILFIHFWFWYFVIMMHIIHLILFDQRWSCRWVCNCFRHDAFVELIQASW